MRPLRIRFARPAFALAIALATVASAQERVAQLSKVSGKVLVTRSADGKPEEATQAGPRVRNGSVSGGDVVSTAPGASATLVFTDGTQVELKEKTALTIQEVDQSALVKSGKTSKPIGRRIRVLAGNIWTNVSPNPQVATEFETPSGVAAVKGTTFTISVDGGTEVAQ